MEPIQFYVYNFINSKKLIFYFTIFHLIRRFIGNKYAGKLRDCYKLWYQFSFCPAVLF
jgi:hypothetical protein